MSSDEVIRYYTDFADSYDNVVLRDRDYIAFEKIPLWLLGALPKRGAHILDLGCGTGLGARPFFDHEQLVTGLDITPKMIEQCKRLPFEKLICQSLEEPLPLANADFDGAIMLGVMEFIRHPTTVFAEVRRVLKEKGLFGITVPKKVSAETETKLGILTYQTDLVEGLFQEAGFQTLYTEQFQGFVHEGESIHYMGYLLQAN